MCLKSWNTYEVQVGELEKKRRFQKFHNEGDKSDLAEEVTSILDADGAIDHCSLNLLSNKRMEKKLGAFKDKNYKNEG